MCVRVQNKEILRLNGIYGGILSRAGVEIRKVLCECMWEGKGGGEKAGGE